MSRKFIVASRLILKKSFWRMIRIFQKSFSKNKWTKGKYNGDSQQEFNYLS